MKLIYLIFFILFLSNAYCDTAIEQQYENWEVIKNSPFLSFSAEFSYTKNNANLGKVVRNGILCPRYYYDVFDNKNNFLARGITRFFSFGLFSQNLMDIDIYSENDSYIGCIEGKYITRSRSKFVFYNDQGYESAAAYLDAKTADFLIVSSQGVVIAKIKGNTCGEVGILDMEYYPTKSSIDENMLKIFGAFVSDYHESFLEKPKEIHHYHTEYIYRTAN